MVFDLQKTLKPYLASYRGHFIFAYFNIGLKQHNNIEIYNNLFIYINAMQKITLVSKHKMLATLRVAPCMWFLILVVGFLHVCHAFIVTPQFVFCMFAICSKSCVHHHPLVCFLYVCHLFKIIYKNCNSTIPVYHEDGEINPL